MRLDVPAVVASKVAMLGARSQVCVTSSEANLGDLLSGELVTITGEESIDGPLIKSHGLVKVALGVGAGTGHLDVDDGVVVQGSHALVVDFHGVDHDVDVLVPINLVRGNIMEIGRVQPVVGDFTFAQRIVGANGVSGFSSVSNTDSEAKVGIAVGDVEGAKGVVGATCSVLDGWHGIGQASEDSSRLDLVINYLNKI